MSTIEFVDVATAREAGGVRIVVGGSVPSPWSEAAKGLFRIANVPVLAVRQGRDATEVIAWTGIDNVPIVLNDAEPPRTNWSAITAFAARLAPDVLVPDDIAARAETFGVLEQIAGEDGIGWNSRLAMIDASITSGGERGFPLRIGHYLAKRYNYTPELVTRATERIAQQLDALRDRLRGHDYFGGERPSAIDVYAATFLTPLSAISDADCPAFAPHLRPGFAAAHGALGHLVPAELVAHRKRMFDRHLAWPIEL